MVKLLGFIALAQTIIFLNPDAKCIDTVVTLLFIRYINSCRT